MVEIQHTCEWPGTDGVHKCGRPAVTTAKPHEGSTWARWICESHRPRALAFGWVDAGIPGRDSSAVDTITDDHVVLTPGTPEATAAVRALSFWLAASRDLFGAEDEGDARTELIEQRALVQTLVDSLLGQTTGT